jgi:hypothetical protein
MDWIVLLGHGLLAHHAGERDLPRRDSAGVCRLLAAPFHLIAADHFHHMAPGRLWLQLFHQVQLLTLLQLWRG